MRLMGHRGLLASSVMALTLVSRTAGAWVEDRLTLLPLVVDASAETAVNRLTRALIETVAAKELRTTSGLCVVKPEDLRAIERDPLAAPQICGLPAVEALGTRQVVHLAIAQAGARWQLTSRWIDRRASEIMVQADLNRPTLTELLEELPPYFVAVAESAARYPRAAGRLLGVIAEPSSTSCTGLGQRAVDAEATISWSEPVPWMVAEYGPVRLARARQARAVEIARRRAVQEAVGGAFTWVLAQLGARPREIIHANQVAFDNWAKRQITIFAFADWVAREEILEERVEAAQRSARSMVRSCVEVSRMQAAVGKRIALLDTTGKPGVVVITTDSNLGEALTGYLAGFHFAPVTFEVVAALPNLGFERGRGSVQKALRQAGAEVAILARVAVTRGRPEPNGPVEVQIDLNAVSPACLSLATAIVRERPPHATMQTALGRVTSNWPRSSQPVLEELLSGLSVAADTPIR